jgi:hypothetical protein
MRFRKLRKRKHRHQATDTRRKHKRSSQAMHRLRR